MLDVDLTPSPPDYLALEGAISDPGHGIVDVVAEGMVEIEEGELRGGVGVDRLVGIVGGGVYVFEVSVGVVLQLPIYDGVIRPLDLNVVRLHGLPPRKRDLKVDKVGPLVQDKAWRGSIESIIVPARWQVSILPGRGIVWSAISSHILLASGLIRNRRGFFTMRGDVDVEYRGSLMRPPFVRW